MGISQMTGSFIFVIKFNNLFQKNIRDINFDKFHHRPDKLGAAYEFSPIRSAANLMLSQVLQPGQHQCMDLALKPQLSQR